MKIVKIGNYQYRAKQVGFYPIKDGEVPVPKCEYQFRLLLFGIIPLPWDSYYGTFSLAYIENDLREKLKNYTGQILNLDL